jgi:uncharacterized protein (TIGR03000 family)
MSRLLRFLALITGLLLSQPLAAQDAGPTAPAYLKVKVPADAQVRVEGRLMTQSGELREFVSPPLPTDRNKAYTYTLTATYKGKDGSDVTVEKSAEVKAGETVIVDLSTPVASQQPEASVDLNALKLSSEDHQIRERGNELLQYLSAVRTAAPGATPKETSANQQRAIRGSAGSPKPSPQALDYDSLPSDGGYYSRYQDYSYRPPVRVTYVSGYYRRDGTYVRPYYYYRTPADGRFWNDNNSQGNVNPYAGRPGTRRPPASGYDYILLP